MTTTELTVDQLTDQILTRLDKYRYHPEKATMWMRHLLRCHNLPVTEQNDTLNKVVYPVLTEWARADTYLADPEWACDQWEDDIPHDGTITSWTRIRADQLRWDAQQIVRNYLTELLEEEPNGRDYVCPQCGPDPAGGERHTQTHHVWPPSA